MCVCVGGGGGVVRGKRSRGRWRRVEETVGGGWKLVKGKWRRKNKMGWGIK